MHLNKAALAEAIAKKAGASKKEAEDMVDSFVSIIISTLKDGGSVGIAGFGQFSAKTRAGRVGVNPQNPTEKINIPPVTVPKFKAGLALKKALKEDGRVSTPKVEHTMSKSATEVSPAEPYAEDTTEETTQI